MTDDVIRRLKPYDALRYSDTKQQILHLNLLELNFVRGLMFFSFIILVVYQTNTFSQNFYLY